jgi:hypothetical protein
MTYRQHSANADLTDPSGPYRTRHSAGRTPRVPSRHGGGGYRLLGLLTTPTSNHRPPPSSAVDRPGQALDLDRYGSRQYGDSRPSWGFAATDYRRRQDLEYVAGTATAVTEAVAAGSTSSGPTIRSGSAAIVPMLFESTAVLTLIIVASLCAVVGAIYVLIYFKSIKPMSARSRSYMQQGGPGVGGGGIAPVDEGGRLRSTHPFFRRS